MKTARIGEIRSWFDVLITSDHTQVAVMLLDPGAASSAKPRAHRESDQVVLVLEGTIVAQIAHEERELRRGDIVVVPAGTRHRFRCAGDEPALAFSVFGPPAFTVDAPREERDAPPEPS